MTEEKIGIAISLYDKFEDLAILVDILRHNFNRDYIISVHCNHPKAETKIENLDIEIDHLSTEIEIEYRQGTQKTMRILNSIKKSCKRIIDDCDYIMHLHADAWILNEEKLDKIIKEMNEKSSKLAIRGKKQTFNGPGQWLGSTMDQYFIANAKYFREISFFCFNTLDPLPHLGIHNSMMLLFLGKVGRSKIYRYSDFSKDVYWDGKRVENNIRCRPSVYNEEYGLFHCAREEFPEDYGKKVQADRLRKSGLRKGNHIENLLSNHTEKTKEITDFLQTYKEKQDKQLRRLLIDPDKTARMFSTRQEKLNKNRKKQIITFSKNLLWKTYYKLNSVIFRFTPFENPVKGRRSAKKFQTDGYEDMEKIYREEVNLKEINHTDAWFEEPSK